MSIVFEKIDYIIVLFMIYLATVKWNDPSRKSKTRQPFC